MSLSLRCALPGLQNVRTLWSSYQVVICYQFGANPLPDQMRVYCQWNHLKYISVKSELKIMYFSTYGVCKMMPILHNIWRRCRYYHHDDVIKFKFFPSYWPLVMGIRRHRRIPFTNASEAEILSFLWAAPEQTFEQTIETLVIWETIALILTSV